MKARVDIWITYGYIHLHNGQKPYPVYMKTGTVVANSYFVLNVPVLSVNTTHLHASDGKSDAEVLLV